MFKFNTILQNVIVAVFSWKKVCINLASSLQSAQSTATGYKLTMQKYTASIFGLLGFNFLTMISVFLNFIFKKEKNTF